MPPRNNTSKPALFSSTEPLRPVRKALWQGPEKDGITFSMLSRFLVCRERFRIACIEGLRPMHQFNHRIEYGQMWHVCEEAHADGGLDWSRQLSAYANGLCRTYPLSQEQIRHWESVCRVQFPLYVEHWKSHPDVKRRTPVLSEHVFRVPYKLRSGRTVFLRGKWDSVDRVGNGFWLQENKTKGNVDPVKMQRQLSFDLQTMMYMVALNECYEWCDKIAFPANTRIEGVRYNVVRRPLSGGKGTIVQKKGSKNVPPETAEEFYGRVAQYIRDEPEHYFQRWNVMITPRDIGRFRVECLNPILETLCDWYDHVVDRYTGYPHPDPFRSPDTDDYREETGRALHWRHPFGVWNALDEGGSTDLDEYILSGNETGLDRVDKLFTELE